MSIFEPPYPKINKLNIFYSIFFLICIENSFLLYLLKSRTCFSRGRGVFSSRWKKHLEDQNFSSNKSEENDISRINFLEMTFSKINFRKYLVRSISKKNSRRKTKFRDFNTSSVFFAEVLKSRNLF